MGTFDHRGRRRFKQFGLVPTERARGAVENARARSLGSRRARSNRGDHGKFGRRSRPTRRKLDEKRISVCSSGKSTLLNVLSGRRKETTKVSGSICLNGREVARETFHRFFFNSLRRFLATILMNKCGFIEQNELFLGSMTVREHLTFQVRDERSVFLTR